MILTVEWEILFPMGEYDFWSPMRMGVIVNVTWCKFHQSNDKDLYVSYITENVFPIFRIKNVNMFNMLLNEVSSPHLSHSQMPMRVVNVVVHKCAYYDSYCPNTYSVDNILSRTANVYVRVRVL